MNEEYLYRMMMLGGGTLFVIGLLKYCGYVALRLLEYANRYLLRMDSIDKG